MQNRPHRPLTPFPQCPHPGNLIMLRLSAGVRKGAAQQTCLIKGGLLTPAQKGQLLEAHPDSLALGTITCNCATCPTANRVYRLPSDGKSGLRGNSLCAAWELKSTELLRRQAMVPMQCLSRRVTAGLCGPQHRPSYSPVPGPKAECPKAKDAITLNTSHLLPHSCLVTTH